MRVRPECPDCVLLERYLRNAQARERDLESDRREARAERDAAYERGLRRGLVIAKEWDESLCPVTHGPPDTVDWSSAEAQMEREIEEAKR